jgi:hypothetical protein
MLGGFRENTRTRMEFLELLKLRSPGVGLSISPATPVGIACLDE